jgi:hypothetical protein
VNRRVIALLAIACALALRVVVPSGWMPATNAQGVVVLVPCPGAEPVKMAHSRHHSKSEKQGHEGKAAQDCSFAPFQASVDVAEAADLLPSSIVVRVAPVKRVGFSYLATGPPAPPPPATGPPALT